MLDHVETVVETRGRGYRGQIDVCSPSRSVWNGFTSSVRMLACSLAGMVFAASASVAAETPTATDEKQNALVGQMTVHRVAEKETLLDIARNYGLGYLEIVSANPGLDPWVPG
ncbi:MAG: LysM domain-containing protein, partial [Pseudomonadota bacterium]